MIPGPVCCLEGCRALADPLAPVPLCDWHLAVASDWGSATTGVTDVLPSPCVLCGSRLGVRWPSGWLCAVCEWRLGDPVDAELPPPRVDVVYYLRFDDRIKIGTTANPRQRLGAIWHDELLAFERGDRLVERRRHAQFAEDRFARTEWFRASETLRAHVAALADGVDDPWQRFARWTSEEIARRG
ncbi:GIY-YIG nuclease family protein [Microbacterium sp. HMH0099]|uniref:GIY-YIG nuclease family protein n=1 Tax=Microbacterium sp. HMH0099 TaxID=3414026 RepID=UPI003BF6A98E